MKYYLQFPRDDGFYYTGSSFYSREEAISYLYRFFESKNGWWNLVRPQHDSWGIYIPTRAYKGDSPSILTARFDTYTKAVEFAKVKFNADSEGKINLIDEA
jgi:hypothetical protein